MDEDNIDNFTEDVRKKLEETSALIPENVMDFFFEKAGVEAADSDVKKLVGLMGQKFITDIASSAFQYHKLHQKAYQKDRRFAREKKPTLQIEDLERAFEDVGVNISRPHYFM